MAPFYGWAYELKLTADNDNANLILIWPHRYFQQNMKVLFYQKYRY